MHFGFPPRRMPDMALLVRGLHVTGQTGGGSECQGILEGSHRAGIAEVAWNRAASPVAGLPVSTSPSKIVERDASAESASLYYADAAVLEKCAGEREARRMQWELVGCGMGGHLRLDGVRRVCERRSQERATERALRPTSCRTDTLPPHLLHPPPCTWCTPPPQPVHPPPAPCAPQEGNTVKVNTLKEGSSERIDGKTARRCRLLFRS